MKRGRAAGTVGGRVLELVLLIGLPIVCHLLVPIMTLVPKPYGLLGIPVMLLGIVLMGRGSRAFRRAGASYTLHGDTPQLVTSGLFRFTRNPMYLGMLTWQIGLAAMLGSLVAFLFPVLLFALANWIMIPMEERRMAQAFGEAYAAYKRRVRRWL